MNKQLIISALIIIMALFMGCKGGQPMSGGGGGPGNGPSSGAGQGNPRAKKDSVLDEEAGRKAAPAPIVDRSNPDVIGLNEGGLGFAGDGNDRIPPAPGDETGATVPEDLRRGLGGGAPFKPESFDDARRRSEEANRLAGSGDLIDPTVSSSLAGTNGDITRSQPTAPDLRVHGGSKPARTQSREASRP